MADSSSRIFSCDASGLKYVSSSLFNIPGFVMGFTKGSSSDGESIRSPTSPLDFGLFSLCNPFGARCTRSSSEYKYKKLRNHYGVGLSIVNSLVDEAKGENGSLDIPPQRKNIIFGPEVKASFLKFPMRSNSLPKNYVISPLSETIKSERGVIGLDSLPGNKRLTSGSETLTSMVTFMSESETLPSSRLINQNFCPKNKVLLTNRGLEDDSSMGTRSSSVPLPIECSQKYAGSLSARDIELSEDYTCIISHGPNPKTTHIFCDCVLEFHTNELSFFCNKDRPQTISGSPTTSSFLGGPTPYGSNKVMSFCYSCNKELEEGTDVHIYSDKAFCSFECRAEEIVAEEEHDKTDMSSSESSSDLNCNEDLFPMCLSII